MFETLLVHDVRAVLAEHQTGKMIINEYDSTGMIVKRKHDMIHILTAHIIDKTGNILV
jgi:hypothetical protein